MQPTNPMSLLQCNVCKTILKRDFNYCPKCGAIVKQAEGNQQNSYTPDNANQNPDINQDRVGIRMDVLENILSDLNDHAVLQSIFGVPVSKGLVIVADDNDLRIEDAGLKELHPDESQKFLDILDEVIRSNSI